MTRKKMYIGVSQDGDGTWRFTVRKANGKIKTGLGHSTAKVAALMRDEYILKHRLEEKSNFPVKRMARMRNEAYEQMFGTLQEDFPEHP
ncbi:hypothetical protein [Candidatus Electrothrix sp.]|uniref:hypothetical protein n=1 Tax=Candidatus Electrothrix sp. TaxID=2170559 RepID=UPI004055D520